jgi:hypothetical protein
MFFLYISYIVNTMKKLLMLNVMLNVNSHDKCKYTVYNDLSRLNNQNNDNNDNNENVILDSRIVIMKNEIDKIDKKLRKINKKLINIKKEFINIKKEFINIKKKFIKIDKQFKEIKVDNKSFNGILTKINQQIKLNEKRHELRL